jgi:2-keto-3-deoxy-L-rhamnonate aldolase RhmA
MEPALTLRRKLASGDLVTGALATRHFWPGLVEVVKNAGLDYLIIDLEHLTHDHESVVEGCAIGRLIGFPVFLRPPQAEFTAIRLAMDLGPCGLLVPCVESAETMQVIQDAVWMPPRGKRRPGGPGNAWVPNVHYQTWRTTVEDALVVLPQIESRGGLAHAREIAAHPLTTAIAVGPYDLSASLGVCWDPGSAELQDALVAIREAGRAAGKTMWMIGDGAELARRGYTFLCIGEPIAALQAKLAEMDRAAKASPPQR